MRTLLLTTTSLAAIFLIGVMSWNIQSDFTAYSEEISGTDEALELVPIPGGVFTMRSSGTPGQETPNTDILQQEVQVDPFWMSTYEITWGQYEAFADELPENLEEFTATVNGGAEIAADAIALPTRPYVEMSFGMGKDGYPAISMTHYAAVMFTRWLTLKTGHFYRLPTEAEWEFACRGGGAADRWFESLDSPNEGGSDTRSPGSDEGGKNGGMQESGDPGNGERLTLDDAEWHAGNSNGTYNRVAVKEPNPYGLYDMLGNVAEWTTDQYYDDYVAQIQRANSAGVIEGSDGEESVTGDVSATGQVAVTFDDNIAVNPWFPPTELYPRAVRGGSWMDAAETLSCSRRRGSEARWKQLDPQLPKSLWWHTSAPYVGFRVVRPLETPTREEMERYWNEAIEDY